MRDSKLTIRINLCCSPRSLNHFLFHLNLIFILSFTDLSLIYLSVITIHNFVRFSVCFISCRLRCVLRSIHEIQERFDVEDRIESGVMMMMITRSDQHHHLCSLYCIELVGEECRMMLDLLRMMHNSASELSSRHLTHDH